jgi:MFS family permease
MRSADRSRPTRGGRPLDPGSDHRQQKGRLRDVPAVVKLLLVSMVLFNIGFYLVVPYLAVHLTDTLGLATAVVGLVLGLRTFSQQGLFFLGGSLADRFGRRRIILWGIALRIIGFTLLAVADGSVAVICGVLLIGFAAALFAPAVESANAEFGLELEHAGVMRRTELFGWEQMSSRLGTLLGPALGAVLLVFPFAVPTMAAAVLFAGLWVGFYLWFPRTGTTAGAASPRLRVVWSTVITNRSFMVFAAICSTQFVALSQLYLMLPEYLDLNVGSQAALGWFYVGAAVLVIAGQRPIVRISDRRGHRTAMVAGLGLMAVSFVIPAIPAANSSTTAPIWSYLALAGWIAVLYLGQMMMIPPMRNTLAVLAREQHLGAHFGMLNTLGGVFALIATVAVGFLFDTAESGGAVAMAAPWIAAAAATAGATVMLWVWWSRSATAGQLPSD